MRCFRINEPFPEWAHSVRNYFNETPASLRLHFQKGRPPGSLPRFYSSPLGPTALPAGLQALALTGDTYQDESGLIWYQMSTAGAVYHYPGDVTFYKKLDAGAKYQSFMPVFKLISPDETGGSREIIVRNWMTNYVPLTNIEWGEETIGKGEWVSIIAKTVFDKAYEGSYNYSETVMKGLDAHEYRDVKPHKNNPVYKNPIHPWTKIEDRRFPLNPMAR